MLRMIGYFKKLGQLGFIMDYKLNIELVLLSKHRSPLGASRKARISFIIVQKKKKKTLEKDSTKTILQLWRLKSLLKLLFRIRLWLNKGEIDLRVDNKARVAALTLLNELILKLDNCYFVLALFRTSHPFLNGFKFIIKGKYYYFYNNDVYYRFDNYTNSLYIPNL